MKPHPLSPSLLVLFIISILISLKPVLAQIQHDKPEYLDPRVAIEDRIDSLLSKMTLEEKIAQLQCTMRNVESFEHGIGGVGPALRSLDAKGAAERANEIQKFFLQKTRLGIPTIIHDEALHGLLGNGATSFPQAIGLASTWDTLLLSKVARVIGRETRSRGIRQVLSPVVNIARDVRWGRVEETYGEDPFLSSRMGVAFCRAIEQEGVITTPKHYVANVGDGGRDSHPIFFSERLLREVYFPPFKATIQEGGARSIMAAYNALDDIPCSSNKWLLTDVLRREWGFQGFVVSDYGSVAGIKTKHFIVATEKGAAAKAVEAGLDMELPSVDFYGAPLLQAVQEQLVPMYAVDSAARNILRAKFSLGLFEDPYVDAQVAARENNSPEHRQLAREAARKAIVLLKNEGNTLPLRKDLKSIAVIGPMADSAYLGDYSGFGMEVITIFQGIRNKVSPSTRVIYEKGVSIGFASLPPIPTENLIPTGGRPGQHGLRGKYYKNMDMSGTPALTRIDRQVNFEWAMGSPDSSIPPDHFSVRWTGTLVPSVSGVYAFGASTDDGLRLYLDGKLLIESWFDRGATMDVVNIRLEAGRRYDLRMEYYENEGWSYASLGWQLKSQTDPKFDAAVKAAQRADAAIVAVGITEGEGYDRANLDLPASEEHLIRAIAETGRPTIVVLLNGSAITMKDWIDTVAAIVEAWYPGEEGGNAIADVLFGDYNPGGKLPLTFPQFVGQVPLYYETKPTGRGYDYSDMSGRPLFPFGHGLSYTSFSYSNIAIEPATVPIGKKVRIRCEVQNQGDRRGDEVVQLYLHDPVASVTRPLKQLRGFQRVTLEPKQKTTITFEIGSDELEFLDEKMKPIIEPGTIEVLLASSSEDIRLRSNFELIAR